MECQPIGKRAAQVHIDLTPDASKIHRLPSLARQRRSSTHGATTQRRSTNSERCEEKNSCMPEARCRVRTPQPSRSRHIQGFFLPRDYRHHKLRFRVQNCFVESIRQIVVPQSLSESVFARASEPSLSSSIRQPV